ncbi:MAG: NfeD family protein [Actinobacteria bacterium]|nr:NfeD family protein [Actinomycetota bacterium]
MDLSSGETWRWIWLLAAAGFAAGEIAVAGTFFLLSFAIGATAAAVVAFVGGGVIAGWVAFVAVSGASLAVLFPLGRRLDARNPTPQVGAHRWEGQIATVLQDIPAGLHESGAVRIDREEWRAESTNGSPVPAGTRVVVARVAGTRLVVIPHPIEVAPPRTSGPSRSA